MSREELQELRLKKRKIKRAVRRKRQEILGLENELKELNRHQKTLKQIELNKKYKKMLLDKARRGEIRLSKSDIMRILSKEEGEAA